MSQAQILGYPLLLIAALELFLGLLLLKQNPRNSHTNRSAAACAIAAALWSLSAALMYIRLSQGMDYLFFARFSWIGWFTVPTAIQTVLFLEDEKSRMARIAGWVLYPFWAIVLGLCLFTDLIVTDGYIPIPFTNRPGPIEMPLRLMGSAMAFWLIYEIFRLRSRVTGYRRAQLNYYLYGTILFGTGGAVIGGFLQLFTGHGLEPSLSAYFSLPWVLLIFYAITRFRLFDIRFVVSRTVFVLLLSFSISALQFGLFKALEPVLGGVASIIISVPIIGVLFFGTPLSRVVQRWINELLIGRRYEHHAMLKDSTTAMITILKHEQLLRYIVNSVRNGFGVENACLYLRGPGRGYEVQECYGDDKYRWRTADVPGGVLARLEQGRLPLLREELSVSMRPGDPEIAAALHSQGVEIVVPLVTKGQILGFLSLSERPNGDHYFQNDIDVLQTVAGYAAVAIENARLFEESSRMRASLRESEDLFRILADTTAAAIFIHRGGKLLYANAAGARMTGYSIEEFLDMDFWRIVHPEHQELVRKRGQERLTGAAIPQQYEFKIIKKDGSDGWALMTAGSIEFGGRPAIIGTLMDITDLKRAEEEQKRLFEENEKYYRERIAEQERFRAILSATLEGFWINDADERFLFVNDAYCRMTGYRREELMAMSIADVETIESPAMIQQHTQRIRENGHDLFETRHRRKDGSLIDLEISVNHYAPEGIFFSFLRDITDRKKAEQEKARLSAEKENILKDLHDGIGGLTTNINLLAELARKSDDLCAVRRSLATISELSREGLSEIRGFIQSLDTRELTWRSVAAELHHLGGTMIEPHGIRLSFQTSVQEQDGGPGSVVAMNLFRIYKESLVNIVKHAKATEVNIAFAVEGGCASLDIHDDGVGIDARQGAGRGLANMRARAEAIRGTLNISGGKGTHISLSVPLP